MDVPDSITTWVTEAIGLSEEKGLGLAKSAELRTFKPFFVDFTLPYGVIRGEQTKVPLTVYNYLSTCAEVRGRKKGWILNHDHHKEICTLGVEKSGPKMTISVSILLFTEMTS